MRPIKWRFTFVALLTVLAIYGVSPSIIYFSSPKEIRNDQEALQKSIPDWLPQQHVKLGLDLQGGVQLVLGVSTVEAVDNKLGRDSVEITRWAEDEGFKIKPAYVVKADQVIRVELDPSVDLGDFKEALFSEFSGLKQANRDGQVVDFEYDESQVSSIKASAIEQAERVIRSRVDKWGVSEPIINRRADNSILVQLPGFRDPQKAKELLGRTAQLKFKLVDEDFTGFDTLVSKIPEGVTYERTNKQVHFTSEDRDQLVAFLKANVPENKELLFERQDIPGSANKARYKSYVVEAATAMTGEDILDAYTQQGGGIDPFPEVGLKFTAGGSKRMADVSGENIGKRLGIILDDVVYSDPVLKVKITQGAASITLGSGKGYNEVLEEAQALALILKSGALPATITILEERQVGASLGPELANQGIKGALVGLVLVLLYMVFYYRRPGFIACAALVLNAVFLLALMAGLGFALTLPGIAGFILTLGMAVDANVLINERIRYEVRSGKNSKKAVETAFGKVFWTIMDANITTLIAAFVLLETNSSGPIRGFAITLIVGIIVSLFTSLFCTKLFFEMALSRVKSDSAVRNWLGGKVLENNKVYNFNFLRLGKTVSIAAVLISVIALGMTSTKGLNWGVDFAGGTELHLGFQKDVEPKAIRSVAKEAGIESLTVQALEGSKTQYLLRFDKQTEGEASQAEQEKQDVANAINVQQLQKLVLSNLKDFGPEILQVDFVGPQVGKELRNQGVLSVLYAIIFVLLYISIRFDMRFGPGAVIKMVLDIFMMLGFYAFFWRSFDLTSVAAFLTVVGYSVNDTIVIYDRIRENIMAFARRPLIENINTSLNETLSRTINTSVTTVLALAGILVFGTGQIWNFAMAMAVGVVVATISSNFIASTIILWMANWKKAKARKTAALSGGSPVTVR